MTITITPIHRIGELLASGSNQFDKYNGKLLSHDVIQNGTIFNFVDDVTGVSTDKLYVTTHKVPIASPVDGKRLFFKEGFANQLVGFRGINCVLGNALTGTAPICLYYNQPDTLGCVDASCLSNPNYAATTVTNTRYYLSGGNPSNITQHSVNYSISAGINTFALAFSRTSIIEIDWVFISNTNRAFRTETNSGTGVTYECYVNSSNQLVINAPTNTPIARVTILRKA